jgi:hypothetical protein
MLITCDPAMIHDHLWPKDVRPKDVRPKDVRVEGTGLLQRLSLDGIE